MPADPTHSTFNQERIVRKPEGQSSAIEPTQINYHQIKYQLQEGVDVNKNRILYAAFDRPTTVTFDRSSRQTTMQPVTIQPDQVIVFTASNGESRLENRQEFIKNMQDHLDGYVPEIDDPKIRNPEDFTGAGRSSEASGIAAALKEVGGAPKSPEGQMIEHLAGNEWMNNFLAANGQPDSARNLFDPPLLGREAQAVGNPSSQPTPPSAPFRTLLVRPPGL